MQENKSVIEETRSEELSTILEKEPSFAIRFGSFILLFITATFICLCFIIKYPTKLVVSIRLTSNIYPKKVSFKSSGKLEKILVKDGDEVRKNEILAYLETSADINQVLQLEKIAFTQKEAYLNYSLKDYNKLGELQSVFQSFDQTKYDYTEFKKRGYYINKVSLLEDEIKNLHSAQNDLTEQKSLLQKDAQLSSSDHAMNLRLFNEKVISKADLNRSESSKLSKDIQVQQINQASRSIDTQINIKKNEKLELEKQMNEISNKYNQSFKILKNHIEKWKRDYLIYSPENGIVSFMSDVQENQFFKSGQEIMYITQKDNKYYVIADVDQINSGKIKVDQKVHIKLNAYSFNEYGILLGKVEHISNLPYNKNRFVVKILLQDGLTTNYNFTIKPKQGLVGVGEIITEDLTLGQRIIHKFRRISIS